MAAHYGASRRVRSLWAGHTALAWLSLAAQKRTHAIDVSDMTEPAELLRGPAAATAPELGVVGSVGVMRSTTIEYVTGDATAPTGPGPKIIAHVCNDVGGWGLGFVLALSRRWREPEEAYLRWYEGRASNDFGLGAVQLVAVGSELWVANLVGQHGLEAGPDGPPVRYDAIETALTEVAVQAVGLGATVHMPRIGSGLAGGDWSVIEATIERTLSASGVRTVVYTL